MKYLTRRHDQEMIEELTAEQARFYLEGYWKDETLADIFDGGKHFKLFTPYRDIWTETDDGVAPMTGYGFQKNKRL